MPAPDTAEMELRDYLLVLRRRKLTILLTVILVVGAALGVSFIQTPVYEATTEVLVRTRASEQILDPDSSDGSVDAQRALDNELRIVESRSVRESVEQELGHEPNVSASGVGETDVIEISARSAEAERARDDANAYARIYLDISEKQAVDELLAAGEEIQAKIDELNARRAALDPADNTSRQRIDSQLVFYTEQLDRIEVASNLAEGGGGQVIAEATLPGSPVSPNPVRNGLVALALGLVLGIGLAFLRDYLDDSIKSKDDVEQTGTHLSVVGIIPVISGWRDRRATRVVAAEEPQSAPAEACRTLRTSLQFLGLDRPIHALQVTSAAAVEGKTTTVANLAVTFARTGDRVIVVDCDLRRPRLHQFFGLDNEIGFTSVLLGAAPLSDALQPIPDQPGLAVLTSGPPPPNPAELLSGARAREVVDALVARCDSVIVDTPPVLPVTDALVVSALVDAILLVVASRTSTKRSVHRAVELLEQIDAPLLGAVLNQVRAGSGYHYDSGYGYGYGNGSARTRRQRKAEARR